MRIGGRDSGRSHSNRSSRASTPGLPTTISRDVRPRQPPRRQRRRLRTRPERRRAGVRAVARGSGLMSVNGVAFYACACLVVLSSGATVWLRPLRHTIIAAAGFAVSLGLLLVATGADLLALLSVAVLLGGLGIGVVTARRGAFGPE